MADKTADEFAPPKAQGDAPPRGPRAVSADYDQSGTRIVVRLQTGVDIGFAPQDAQRLGTASESDLEAVGLEALGIGQHCRAVGADLCVPLLSKGLRGSRHWMAARHGARGSHARSPAAQRENGKRVGRATPVGA